VIPSFFTRRNSFSVDFSTFANGRSDLVTAPANTTLTFNVTNLNAWQVASDGSEQDMLELFTSGGNVYIAGIDYLLTTGLAAGATTLSGTTSDIHSYGGIGSAGLIDDSKGDQPLLTQLVYHTLADGTPYTAVAKSLALGPSFMESSGAASTISGAFTDVPQNQTYSAVFKRSQFQAYKAAVNPNASCYEYINLSAVPGLATYGNAVTSADLLQVSPAAGSTDITLANVAFGNPYPSWDGINATLSMTCSVSYAIGMATTPATLYAAVSVSGPTVAGAVTPILSPATAPTIAGKDAFGNNTAVGLMPTIAWHAPAIGSPTNATIEIFHFTVVNGTAGRKLVAALEVDSATQTSLQVPSGVLASGETYAFELVLSQGMANGTEASASLASGTFTP